MRELVLLTFLKRHEDSALLLLRILIGGFLIYGVADNVVSATRMQEFVVFLRRFGFPAPEIMARVSVYAQLFCGLAFVFGLLTRWAGIVCAINFVVAILMVDRFAGIRGSFPSACLIMFGLYVAARGAGRFSVDSKLERDQP